MWKLKTSERISHWRDFRKNLGQLTLSQALQATVDFWQSCPFAPYYLDATDSDEWPNPWELIAENYYCDVAKCLGIVYTIVLSDHGAELDPEIRVYYDPMSRLTYHLVFFDRGKYVINFSDGEIVNIESISNKFQLKYHYQKQDLKLE
jgi:hypothetical protein